MDLAAVEEWGDRVPHVAYDAGWDRDCWIVGDRVLHPVGFYNWAGWNQHLPSFPGTLEESNPAGWDPKERLAMMDEHGIHAQVLFPNAIGFEPQAFLGLGDPELTLDCVRAYNDFQTEFASVSAIDSCRSACCPSGMSTRASPKCTVAMRWDIRRVLGGETRQPRISADQQPHWDPVYAAAQDLDCR